MFRRGPFTHVCATRANAPQSRRGPKAMELRQSSAQQLEQGGPDVKAGLIRLPGPVPGCGQRHLRGRL
jgi:hypothetical protein